MLQRVVIDDADIFSILQKLMVLNRLKISVACVADNQKLPF